jgi:ribosomal protein L11 methylase PrmA
VLPARQAIGTDTDPLAVKAAARNAEHNGQGARFVSLQCAPDLDGPEPLAAVRAQWCGAGAFSPAAAQLPDGAPAVHHASTFCPALAPPPAPTPPRPPRHPHPQAGLPSEGAYDLVVANILRGPLLELAPRLGAYVKPGGRLALSGILAEQVGFGWAGAWGGASKGPLVWGRG